jgi:hypothetical protein
MVVGNDKFTKLILLKLRNKLALHIYSRGSAHRSLLDELHEGDEAERLFETKRRRKYRKRNEMTDPSLPAEHEANRQGTAIKLRMAREELGVIDLFAHKSEESRTAYMLRATWERMMRDDPALAEEFRVDPERFIRELEAGGGKTA